jgi:hypothetical protein
MPLDGKLNASDFTLHNVTSTDQVTKLNLALDYLQQSPAAAAVLHEAALHGVAITFNPSGVNGLPYPNNGQDANSLPSHTVIWNPESGNQVTDASGNVLGVQSAATGLGHEFVHSIDPALMVNLKDLIPDYENSAEYVAVSLERVFTGQLGEPGRTDHGGLNVIVDNPTTHTNTATGHWEQTGNNGQVETGPKYEYGQQGGNEAPDFGSTASGGGSNDPYDGSYDDPNYGGDGYGDPGGGGGGGNGGCVAIASLLPDGRTAGAIQVGDTMDLGDEKSLEAGKGTVTYSQLKQAPGFRITTEKGVSLVCSDTAPIPTKGNGLVTPQKLLGEQVAVRWDENGVTTTGWETIVKVEPVGIIRVQHITVGDKCFWAGEKKGAYILHHNMKDAGGGDYWPDEWDPLKTKPDESHLTTHHDHGGAAALIGVAPPPPIDGFGLI